MTSPYRAILAVLCLSLPTFADIPEAEIGTLYQRAKSQPREVAARVAYNAAILADGRKCLDAHPETPPEAPGREILVRRVMLPAALRVQNDDPSPEHRDQLRALATEVAGSSLTEGHRLVEEKVAAAETLAKLEIWPEKGAPPREAAARIRELVGRFPLDPARESSKNFHGQALVCAARLAVAAKEQSLADEYCADIAKAYLATSGALDVLAQAGHPARFEGEMTTLDGKTLHFPGDFRGQVLVIDFWATWCVPCVASLPHVREIHDKYKDRGVQVIGVSCDSPMAKETPEQNREKVAGFIKTKDLPWTQTYSGAWPQAAVKYGVGSIPKVFVIGRDGRILTTEGRGREEELIEQALAAPQTP